mmetsp:Transcript_12698/g.20244  ORF Transcript_12698/g.20244 Transcript_12698/m.20244 type:complete len:271 (-) Transcript_12698:71-883(-)
MMLNFHDAVLYDRDVQLFKGRSWLNDACINFYFRYLEYDVFGHEGAHETVIFMDPAVVSFMMLQCTDDDDYDDLRRGLKLDQKSLIFVPVNDNTSFDSSSTHWSLLACVRYNNAINCVHLDSGGGANGARAEQVAAQLRQTLLGAADRGSGNDIPTLQLVDVSAQTPRQTNSYDCGMYTIVFAEFFAKYFVGVPEIKEGEGEEKGPQMAAEEEKEDVVRSNDDNDKSFLSVLQSIMDQMNGCITPSFISQERVRMHKLAADLLSRCSSSL